MAREMEPGAREACSRASVSSRQGWRWRAARGVVGMGWVQNTSCVLGGPESSLLCLICLLVHEGDFGFPVQVRLGSGAVPGQWRRPVCACGVGWPSQNRSVWGRPR